MGVGLHIELEEIEKRMILRLDGRIDGVTSPKLEKKLEELTDQKHFVILLDFNSVDYLSSAGLRVLLSAAKKIHAHHGSLVLFSVLDDVKEIIKMTGFDKILPIVSNEKEALHYHKK
jgi:anti-anti-sigma factor